MGHGLGRRAAGGVGTTERLDALQRALSDASGGRLSLDVEDPEPD